MAFLIANIYWKLKYECLCNMLRLSFNLKWQFLEDYSTIDSLPLEWKTSKWGPTLLFSPHEKPDIALCKCVENTYILFLLISCLLHAIFNLCHFLGMLGFYHGNSECRIQMSFHLLSVYLAVKTLEHWGTCLCVHWVKWTIGWIKFHWKYLRLENIKFWYKQLRLYWDASFSALADIWACCDDFPK